MTILNERGAEPPAARPSRARRRQLVALWLGVGALLSHSMAWAAISAANVLAESNALFFIPFALVALGLVITGLALGLTATVLVFRALPLGSSGVVAVVLAAAGVVIAVLTFVTMAG